MYVINGVITWDKACGDILRWSASLPLCSRLKTNRKHPFMHQPLGMIMKFPSERKHQRGPAYAANRRKRSFHQTSSGHVILFNSVQETKKTLFLTSVRILQMVHGTQWHDNLSRCTRNLNSCWFLEVTSLAEAYCETKVPTRTSRLGLNPKGMLEDLLHSSHDLSAVCGLSHSLLVENMSRNLLWSQHVCSRAEGHHRLAET